MDVCTMPIHWFSAINLNVLHSRQNSKDCKGVASLIFVCMLQHPDLGTTLVKCCVHGIEHILLSSLKRRLPLNHTNFSEIFEIGFNATLPKRKQQEQRFTQYPTILKFFAKTTTIQSVNRKRLQF